MPQSSEENSGEKELKAKALESLREGVFRDAKDSYAELLEAYPDQTDFACGFYASSYWLNREDILSEDRSGSERASGIMKAWDRFEAVCEEKKFLECQSFSAAMKNILGLAADAYREEFQGAASTSSVNTELLLDLSRCLIRIEDYENASDILQYAARLNKNNPNILFLLGEAYLSPEDPEFLAKGIACYRDAFFLEPEALDVSIIASLPVGEVLRDLYEKHKENLETTLYWLPAALLAEYFIPDLKKMEDADLKSAAEEVRRLNSELRRVDKKFIEKVRSRISFYCLILMHHFKFIEPDSELYREYENVLRETAEDLCARIQKK